MLCGSDRFIPRYGIQGYFVQDCEGCGLTQLHPLPDDETITGLYDDAYYEAGEGRGYAGYTDYEAEYRATFEDDLRRIAGLFPPGHTLRILDVGCGPGAFLSIATHAGHDAVGLDIIPAVVEQAQRRFPGRVFLGRIEDVPAFTSKPFDVVFASHVIEHITTPLDFTRTCAGLLREGGALVYVTPNIRSWLARISGSRWVSFKIPEHVAYYAPHTMRALFAKSGLEFAEINSAYEHHNVAFLAERVRRLIRPADRLIPRIERTALFRDRVFRVTSGSMRAIARRPLR